MTQLERVLKRKYYHHIIAAAPRQSVGRGFWTIIVYIFHSYLHPPLLILTTTFISFQTVTSQLLPNTTSTMQKSCPKLFLSALPLYLLATRVYAEDIDRQQQIATSLMLCEMDISASNACRSVYSMDQCLVEADSSLWEEYYFHRRSPNVAATPLGITLKNPDVRQCVCEQQSLQSLEKCMSCVRKVSKLDGEIDLLGVGFVAENACGVVLPSFQLSKDVSSSKNSASSSQESSTTTSGNTESQPPNPEKSSAGESAHSTTTSYSTTTPSLAYPTQTSSAAVARVARQMSSLKGVAALLAFTMSLF